MRFPVMLQKTRQYPESGARWPGFPDGALFVFGIYNASAVLCFGKEER